MKKNPFDQIGLGMFLALCLMGLWQAGKYFSLGLANMALTALALEALMLLLAWAAWQGRMPFLLLGVAAGGFVLNSFLNYGETTHFASLILWQGILAAVWAVLGTGWMLWRKEKIGRLPWLPLALMLLIVAAVGWVWKTNVDADRDWDGHAKRAIWAVPLGRASSGRLPSSPGTVFSPACSPAASSQPK